jgi:hypothetical protein
LVLYQMPAASAVSMSDPKTDSQYSSGNKMPPVRQQGQLPDTGAGHAEIAINERNHDPVRKACENAIARFSPGKRTVTLYRPVGPEELDLIAASGWREFPPRLPDHGNKAALRGLG